MATGSTSAAEFASDSVQFYEKDEWGYSYVVPRGCNLTDVQSWNSLSLPTASSLGTGIVVEDTIMLCEGYTSSGVRECYQLIEGQGIQARPPLPIPNGGHSVYVHRERSQDAWWVAPNTQGGTKNILEAYFLSDTTSLEPGAWEFEQPLPEPLNVVCLMKIAAQGSIGLDYVFLSGVPTTSSSTGNKNWIKQIGPSPNDDSHWVQLPDSIEKRLGGSCGVLHQNSNSAGSTENSTVIVMAGSLWSSTSEFLLIPDNLLQSPWIDVGFLDVEGWVMGPDVGEAR